MTNDKEMKNIPTKEDVLYYIGKGTIPKVVGEEVIKQIESFPKIQVPRGQSKGFAGLKCRYEFATIKVNEVDDPLDGEIYNYGNAGKK